MWHLTSGAFDWLYIPLCGSAGKESACNAGDLGSIPGLGRCPGERKGYPLQYSGLENSMDYIVAGVAKSRTRLSDFHFTFIPIFIRISGYLPKWWNTQQWKVIDFTFLGSKITSDGVCSHEIKRCLLLGRKAMINLESVLESRDITLSTKVHLVKTMVFPVVMYGCEGLTLKKAEH